MAQKTCFRQMFQIWSWGVTLTFELAIWFLSTAHYLMMVYFCVKLYWIPTTKQLWTKQAVLSHLTLKCDLDLGPSHTVLPHSKKTHDVEHLCQVISNFCNQWKNYGPDKKFYHIWPWTVTLTLLLVTLSLLTTYCLM